MKCPALRQELRSCCSMNCTIYTASAKKRVVCCIHNCLHMESPYPNTDTRLSARTEHHVIIRLCLCNFFMYFPFYCMYIINCTNFLFILYILLSESTTFQRLFSELCCFYYECLICSFFTYFFFFFALNLCCFCYRISIVT